MSATTHVLTADEALTEVDALRRLLGQLSPQVLDMPQGDLVGRIVDERVVLVVARLEGGLVGTATLSVSATVSHGAVGHVDDVVVDSSARGRGVGRALLDAVHDEARRLGLRHVDLTSRPSREAANALYRSLGYELRETNCYRLRFRE